MWNFRPILLFIFFLGFSCSFTKEESILYQLSLYDLDGRPVSLKEYKGKVLLLDVWASWCEPCKDAVPVLEKLSKDLQGKNGVLLGINTEPELSKEEHLKAVKEFGITYPFFVDRDFTFINQYKVEGQPALIVFSPSGILLKIQYGVREKDYPKLRANFSNWLSAP
ncbi:TlpA disulfide reductase family protein [Leptospira borgpetersenii]|uniref:Thiol-disulfide isomerase or thioredoxin n=1 Tax=Leptospira borgpetersenii serovar Hardjo-bovis (strain JB197) TaxID=355277 RepID=Q04T74_LEPBJ|nr:TlpA disulfide reductase family protein [Leptospira borgpetersenii]ABJ75896.1 Thiol-disulfide isomerase or thioredoxin [Leptospira borgpetersenii serovar Hardjo-bovis str. JB197]AMX71058.1 thiol-disulfide isomerase [Leptospira borgpetersenii serovar Hardjo]MBE8364803.1 TlpA family protein disulfide reductase [Leptospira borgpetersenii serovar Balcanica]MBE8366626.1 TlpA family protein disulfide reductase [Leptospira borgpetersenii serovar Balcanica]MBE8399097.1 TlpA family protein disulfide